MWVSIYFTILSAHCQSRLLLHDLILPEKLIVNITRPEPRSPCGFAPAGSSYYKMWAVRSQKRLSAWQHKDWHGLHESSYCYFKVYMGTRNLNIHIFILHTFLVSSFSKWHLTILSNKSFISSMTPHIWAFSTSFEPASPVCIYMCVGAWVGGWACARKLT